MSDLFWPVMAFLAAAYLAAFVVAPAAVCFDSGGTPVSSIGYVTCIGGKP